MRRAVLSAAGAGIFFALDSVHVRVGIWKAAGAHVVPWWYLTFYFLGIFAGAEILRRIERRNPAPVRPNLALDLGLFGALLAAHILFFRPELLLTALSVVVLGGRLAFFRRPGDLLVAATLAVLEAGAEITLAQVGLFAYSTASLGPLPLWHPPFWGALALSIRGFFLAADPRPRTERARSDPEAS